MMWKTTVLMMMTVWNESSLRRHVDIVVVAVVVAAHVRQRMMIIDAVVDCFGLLFVTAEVAHHCFRQLTRSVAHVAVDAPAYLVTVCVCVCSGFERNLILCRRVI